MATKPTKPKVRAPEEVWYDVHKHPEGVPGGMGKSPEHHLRGRGWSGYEINEGSGKKTIQYRNHKHPDFVVSYGGGTSTKPDHNFRVLYMGTNTNVPKVTRAYSVAEAMNKVEELHQLHSGLVVQPMTHSSAFRQRREDEDGFHFFIDEDLRPSDRIHTDQPMIKIKNDNEGSAAYSEYKPGEICETCYLNNGYEEQGPEGHPGYEDPAYGRVHHPYKPMSFDGRRFSAVAPAQPRPPGTVKTIKPRDMTDANSYPEFPNHPEKGRAWWNPERKQLKEIPDSPPIKPDKPVVIKAVAAFWRGQQSTWED